MTINYVYDPLNRLTEANYLNYDYYHYTYDAVGNRVSQTTFLSGVSLGTTYGYDNANRLTSVNGVTYTWDNNGNLLDDGVNAYTYDSANRLKSITQGANTSTFGYNGLGDRLTQNGVHYALDLNAGLTQVLNDGTNTYLYGVERIAQVNTSTEYFLGDALGSVRQMASSSGAITYARAYAPYGTTAQTAGAAQTVYGFTGGLTDPSGLIYLRARYHASGMGRFLTRDTWSGDYQAPLTLNRWNYTSSNPINYTDPSGHFSIACGPFSPVLPCVKLILVEQEWFSGGPIILWPTLVPCDRQNLQLTTPTNEPNTLPASQTDGYCRALRNKYLDILNQVRSLVDKIRELQKEKETASPDRRTEIDITISNLALDQVDLLKEAQKIKLFAKNIKCDMTKWP